MRRLAISLMVAGAVFLAVVLSLPWWLGAALASIGPRFGVSHGGYERIGYSRFAVRDVEVRRPGVRVTIERAEGPTPIVWLWRLATGGEVKVSAGNWRTEVERRPRTTTTNKPRGWVPLRQQLNRLANRLHRWIPEAEVGEGLVVWPKGELAIGPATWRDRVLVSPFIRYRNLQTSAKVTFATDGTIEATGEWPEQEAKFSLHGEGDAIRGTAVWWAQPVEVSARFGPQGWRPLEAHLIAENVNIAGTRARIGNVYATIQGRARVDWSDGDLRADISAEGVPLSGTEAPPLKIDVRGYGEGGVFVAEALEVVLPGVQAQLTDPVSIDRTGHVRSETAGFSFEVDLAQLPWVEAQGRATGAGIIAANAEGRPLVRFGVAGERLVLHELEITRVDARGVLDWPELTLEEVRVTAPDEQEILASGGWNFRDRAVRNAAVRGRVGEQLLRRWLPEKLKFEYANFEGRASGPLQSLTHDGKFEIAGFTYQPVKPADLTGEWSGRGRGVDRLEASATMNQTRFTLSGAVDAAGLRIGQLRWTQADAELLSLVEPAAIRWETPLQVGPLRFVGPNARLDATLVWAETGRIDVGGHGVRSSWFQDIIALPNVAWRVNTLALWGKWENGPASYGLDTEVTIDLGDERSAHVSAQITGDEEALELKLLRASEGEGVVVSATGKLPLVVQPLQRPFVVFDQQAPFELRAATLPNPEFWEKFTQLTGLELVRPEAAVHFGGTWTNPQGEAQLRADRLEAVAGRFKDVWPRIESLDAHLTGDRDGVKLERFELAVNGQAVRVEGWLPLAASRWREFIEDPRSVARRGDLRIRIPDAQLAALAQHFPAFLAPTGRVQLDLTLKPDATVNGFLKISDATSRPLGPLGVLQDVNADMRFAGRSVEFAGVTARMAGQKVTLDGRAELPEIGRPVLDLALKGENLPFVRRTGLLLRGDLDLTLKTANSGVTTIGGRVGLRDSLFLSDVRSLIPTGAKGSATRPPYFSIDAEPLNTWRLDVAVDGDRFMQLRTPVFNGTASAHFKLAGTLAEPRATGEVVIEEGNVRLPFANFEVRQGYVRISPEQPDPQIFVTGTTRRYGYDLRMELSGAATAPSLTFSSSPALEAEQVLLMVMAGQAPNDEFTTTGRQRATRFGAFFGQSLLGTLGGDSAGADRLTISSGEDISEQGRETYNIEYRLSDRWALTGEYDEFDEYYGGFKWRVYSRGGKEDEKE